MVGTYVSSSRYEILCVSPRDLLIRNFRKNFEPKDIYTIIVVIFLTFNHKIYINREKNKISNYFMKNDE